MLRATSLPIRAYQYGLLPPLSHEREVRDLLFTAHRYRNTLTEMERERRKTIRETLGRGLLEAETKAAAVAAQLIASSREIKAYHVAHRTRKTPDDLATRHKALKIEQREALATFREMKRSLYADPSIRGALAEIQSRFAERKRRARGESGLAPGAWGTYQRVEAAADRSQAMPLYDGIEPNDPRFKRYGGGGTLAIHFQDKGMPVEKLFEPNSRVHVAPVDPRAWLDETRRGERRRLSRTTLRFRLGTSELREPVFAEFRMVMHRQIPAGSIISWAAITLRRHGPREEWNVNFTVSLPSPGPPAAAPRESAVAIDLGWRLIPSTRELRVCSYRGEDGRAGELRLSRDVLSGLGEVPDGIRAVRAGNFDVARSLLAGWLAGAPDVPEWMTDATLNLAKWRSPAKLAKVAHLWREARFDGDVEAYGALEAWRYRDHHLWQYEAGQRRSELRHRREIYRRFAAELAQRYGTVVLEDFDLSRIARRPKSTDTSKGENETARANRYRAATGELRACILNAFASRGGESVKVATVDSTHICHACGAVELFDAATFITHVCSTCGAEWDQDANASRVLLERFREARARGPAGEGPALGKESKWSKIKRETAERKAARAAAGTSPSPNGTVDAVTRPGNGRSTP